MVSGRETMLSKGRVDQRLAEIQIQIANEVMPGIIVMEEDTPSRNPDGKLEGLDGLDGRTTFCTNSMRKMFPPKKC